MGTSPYFFGLWITIDFLLQFAILKLIERSLILELGGPFIGVPFAI